MSESETTPATFDYQIGEMVHVFREIDRKQWGEIEKEIKTDSIGQWLATCETLRVNPQERRLQITDILSRPVSITISHLERIMRKSLADATDEAIEAVARHGNEDGNRKQLAKLIEFLVGGRA